MNDATKPTGETITLNIHGAIREIAPEAWDGCAGDRVAAQILKVLAS